MSTEQFLTWLLTSAGCGAATFALVEFADKVLPTPPSGTVKFYAAMLLAFVLPLGAYFAEIALHFADFGVDGLLAAALIGWGTSQLIHKGTEAK